MENKVGVFLTGGGAKGSFEIGFLKALEELEIHPDVICGSSSGAIIGAGATYMDSYELMECWKRITLEKIFSIDSRNVQDYQGYQKVLKLWKELLKGMMKNKSLVPIEEIRKLLYSSLDEDKILSSKIELGITATELPSFHLLKLWKEEMEEDQLLEYIMASLYLPIFKPEKIIHIKHYIDISALRRFPYEMLKEKNCNEVYLVHVGCSDIYRTILTAKRVFDKNVDVNVIYMKDKPSLLDFTKEQTIKNFQDGYDTTMKVLSKR